MLKLIAAARDGATAETSVEPPRRPTPEETARAARFMKTVRDEAEALGIAAEVLATRRDVESLAQGSRDGALLRGWRRAVIGEKLLALTE